MRHLSKRALVINNVYVQAELQSIVVLWLRARSGATPGFICAPSSVMVKSTTAVSHSVKLRVRFANPVLHRALQGAFGDFRFVPWQG